MTAEAMELQEEYQVPRGVYDRPQRKAIRVIGPSIAYVLLTKNRFALIDTDDADRCEAHKWTAEWDRHSRCFYARANMRDAGRWRCKRLHVFLLGKVAGYTVDHRQPGNGLDCRRANLRHATHADQQRNKRVPGNNRLGLKGVTEIRRPGRNPRWRARIWLNGRSKLIGLFRSPEAAHAAYSDEARRQYGEFARSA